VSATETAVLLGGWYCERDVRGAPTHVRNADLQAIQAHVTEDTGETDGRGGVRQRLRAGARSMCACSCGAFLRRRTEGAGLPAEGDTVAPDAGTAP